MIKNSVRLLKKLLSGEIISYLICGVLTTVLTIVIYWLCIASGLSIITSNMIATLTAVIFAYVTNKLFVFKSKERKLVLLVLEISKFMSGRFAVFVIETYLLVLLADLLGETDNMKLISKVFTTALVIVLNYFISKWAVFRKR